MSTDRTTQDRLKNVLFYGLAIGVIYLSYLVFEPFLGSLAWAAVLVVVTYPAHKKLARRWGKNASALASTIAVTLVLIVPMILVLTAFVRQAVGAAQSIHLDANAGHFAWANSFWEHMQSRFPRLAESNFGNLIHQYAEQGATYAAARLGAILKNTAEFIGDLAFTMFGMFYFFRDGHFIAERLRKALPFEPAQQDRLVDDAHDLIFATVTSSLVAALMHGVVGALAFALVGVKSPIFWGVVMGFFSFIPLIGTALVWVPLSISLVLAGHWVAGAILAGVCSIVLGTIDNFLRPLLISGNAEMSTLVIFVAVLGGIHVFGLLGVILGPIVIAIASILLDFYAPFPHGGNKRSEAVGHAKSVVLE